jgi:glycosyltransferase involved in cell wall biosynthesis
VEKGVELHLALLTDRRELAPRVEADGVITHDLSHVSSRAGKHLALSRLTKQIRPDVLHASLWDAASLSQIVGFRHRTPVVVTWAAVGNSASHTDSETWKHHVLGAIERMLARLDTSHFHAVTTGVGLANSRRLGVTPDRVHVVERGRPEPTRTSSESRPAFGSETQGPNARVVLAVGRQEPVKDHVTLLRAFRLVLDDEPDAVLFLAGRVGGATDQIHTERLSLGLEDRVHLLGQRDDVDDLLEMADVFVSSSRSEGAAGGVIEALRSRLPVVATDVPGLRGVLEDRANCLLVPVGEVEALGDAIMLLLTDSRLADQLSARGRVTFEQRFTIERSATGLLEMYSDVRARRPAGRRADDAADPSLT